LNAQTAVLILGIVGALLLLAGGWMLLGPRRSEEEKERARRLLLCTQGRVADAEVVDIEGVIVTYSYEVRGVTYQVTQNITPFFDLLPRDPTLLLGPASIKFSTKNPANSILIGEQWSGIRMARPAALTKPKGAEAI